MQVGELPVAKTGHGNINIILMYPIPQKVTPYPT
jgi:hypothetical protein